MRGVREEEAASQHNPVSVGVVEGRVDGVDSFFWASGGVRQSEWRAKQFLGAGDAPRLAAACCLRARSASHHLTAVIFSLHLHQQTRAFSIVQQFTARAVPSAEAMGAVTGCRKQSVFAHVALKCNHLGNVAAAATPLSHHQLSRERATASHTQELLKQHHIQ